MRTVVCPGLGRDVSAVGFGCASLGSRVSEAQGLRALGLAFERGVTWYDVAPPYGDGEAEGIADGPGEGDDVDVGLGDADGLGVGVGGGGMMFAQ